MRVALIWWLSVALGLLDMISPPPEKPPIPGLGTSEPLAATNPPTKLVENPMVLRRLAGRFVNRVAELSWFVVRAYCAWSMRLGLKICR